MQKKVHVEQPKKPVAKKPKDMMRMRASTSVIESRKKQAALVKKQEKPKSAWQSRRSKNVVSGEKIQLKHRINRVLSETPAVKNARKGGNLVIKNTDGFVVSVGNGKQRPAQHASSIFNGIVKFQSQFRKIRVQATMVYIHAEHKQRQAELEAEQRFRAAADAAANKNRLVPKRRKEVTLVKEVSPDTTNRGVTTGGIEHFCTEYKWTRILPQLLELGAETIEDLGELDDEDFAKMGIKKLAKKRFLRHVVEASNI
jgi:hypothetical protein